MENQNKQDQPNSHIHYFAPKILWTILGILLLVVIAGSVYWWQAQKELATNNKQQETTTDWKTYTNTDYGFEFKYPPTFSNPLSTVGFTLEYQTDVSGQTAQKIYDTDEGSKFVGTILVGGQNANHFQIANTSEVGNLGFDRYILLWQGHPLVITFSADFATSAFENQILSTFSFTQ